MAFQIESGLIEAIRKNRLIVFVGAGVMKSVHTTFPDWRELVAHFLERLIETDFEIRQLKEQWDLDANPNPIEYLEKLQKHQEQISNILKDRLSLPSDCNFSLLEKVWQLSTEVITMNYDLSLDHSSRTIGQGIMAYTATYQDSADQIGQLPHKGVFLFKIHGTLNTPERCVLFSSQYDQAYERSAFTLMLRSLLTTRTCLFVGFSMADPWVKREFERLDGLLEGQLNKHYLISTSNTDFGNFNHTVPIPSWNDLPSLFDHLLTYRPNRLPEIFALKKPCHELRYSDIEPVRYAKSILRDIYLPRPSLDKSLRERWTKEQVMVILGNPLAGKTRAAVQLINEVRERFVLIPDRRLICDFVILPPGNDYILFLDEIDRFYEFYHPVTNTSIALFLDDMLDQAYRRGIKVLATCMTGPEYHSFKVCAGEKVLEMFESPFYIEKLDSSDPTMISQLEFEYSIKLDTHAYDGNFGALFLDLEKMKRRYAQLKEEGEELALAILYALKCLRLSYVFTNTNQVDLDKVISFVNRYLYPEVFSLADRESALNKLTDTYENLNFISIHDGLSIEPSYLKYIVEPHKKFGDILWTIRSLFPRPSERNLFGFFPPKFWNGQLLNVNDKEGCLAVLEEMARNEIHADVVHYNIFLSKPAITFEEGKEILEIMLNQGVNPNAVSFGILLDKREATIKMCLDMVEHMKALEIKPTLAIFNILMNKKDSRFKICQDLLKQLLAQGLAPNVGTLNIIIKKNDVSSSKGIEILSMIETYAIKADRELFCNLMEKLDLTYVQGLIVLRRMQECGVPLNEFIFSLLMNKKDVGLANGTKILKLMRESGVKPNIWIFNSFLGKKDVIYARAMEAFRLMEDLNISPDESTVCALMTKVNACQHVKIVVDIVAKYHIELNRDTRKLFSKVARMYCD